MRLRFERRQIRLMLVVAVVAAASAITVAVLASGSDQVPVSPSTPEVVEHAEVENAEEASTAEARAEFAALRSAFEEADRTGAAPKLTDAQYRSFCYYAHGEFGPEPGNPECRVVFWDVFRQEGRYQTRCTYYALLDDYAVPPSDGFVEEGPAGARPVYKECRTSELLDS